MIFGAGLYSMTPSDLSFFRKQGSVSFAQMFMLGEIQKLVWSF